MTPTDPKAELQSFIDERWSVAQPKFYPDHLEGPRLPAEVTLGEAPPFLAAVRADRGEPALFVVDDDRLFHSDRIPPRADGVPLSLYFFEAPGRLRVETIVHMAAMVRLGRDFGWPREYLIFESPDITSAGGAIVLGRFALDILALQMPQPDLTAKMTTAATRTRVGIEAKANSKLLDKMLREIQACQAGRIPPDHTEHKKCQAIEVLRPELFLGVAASETWRLFTVDQRESRAVLGNELPDLSQLRFHAD